MEISGKDLILGNFRLSDYGLMLASFDSDSTSEDSLGLAGTTIEEYIGNNPIPVYLDDKYTEKLYPVFTVIRNPSVWSEDNLYFSEKDCRSLLRQLSVIRDYQWLKVENYDMDGDIWFRAKITNISCKKTAGRIIGFIFEMECDSCYGWSPENNITIHAMADTPFYIFNNTDELCQYVKPVVTVTPTASCTLQLTNISDHWTTELKNVTENEKITIDSKNEILSTTLPQHDLLLNDFNLKWIRLLPEKNTYSINVDSTVTFQFRVPRKVGFL